jgi:hypothetical protein
MTPSLHQSNRNFRRTQSSIYVVLRWICQSGFSTRWDRQSPRIHVYFLRIIRSAAFVPVTYVNPYSALSPLSTLERLDINSNRENWQDEDDKEHTQRLEVSHPFTSVKNLVLYGASFRLVVCTWKISWGECYRSYRRLVFSAYYAVLKPPNVSRRRNFAIGLERCVVVGR